MIHSTVFALVLSLLLATASAQTSQVRGTGCPSAPFPTATNTKINATATFTLPAMSPADRPVIVLGYQTGNRIPVNPPFACVQNCVLYTQTLSVTILPLLTRTVKVAIPNDIRLWRQCFGVQTAAVRPTGCVFVHGSLSFCIGR